MIVVAVLMISCQVSTWKNTMVGAHTRTSVRQAAKNHARDAKPAAAEANWSNKPIRWETSVGTVAEPARVPW